MPEFFNEGTELEFSSPKNTTLRLMHLAYPKLENENSDVQALKPKP